MGCSRLLCLSDRTLPFFSIMFVDKKLRKKRARGSLHECREGGLGGQGRWRCSTLNLRCTDSRSSYEYFVEASYYVGLFSSMSNLCDDVSFHHCTSYNTLYYTILDVYYKVSCWCSAVSEEETFPEYVRRSKFRLFHAGHATSSIYLLTR